jgi:hypothetical protein
VVMEVERRYVTGVLDLFFQILVSYAQCVVLCVT